VGVALSRESIERLCLAMRYLYVKGLITSLSGNVSIKLSDEKIAITPSRMVKFLLKPEDISIVAMDGTHLAGPRPSIETGMHLAVYRNCAECKSVAHVHGLFAPILAGILDPFLDMELRAFNVKTCYVSELPPGSKELADSVGEAVARGCLGVILKNHGIVGAGRSLGEAIEVVEAIENSFKKSLVIRLLGLFRS
jgi:L-fuculose-phosphate aldolase